MSFGKTQPDYWSPLTEYSTNDVFDGEDLFRTRDGTNDGKLDTGFSHVSQQLIDRHVGLYSKEWPGDIPNRSVARQCEGVPYVHHLREGSIFVSNQHPQMATRAGLFLHVVNGGVGGNS